MKAAARYCSRFPISNDSGQKGNLSLSKEGFLLRVVLVSHVGKVTLELQNSYHFLADLGFVDSQSTVGANQLRQLGHELHVGFA